MVCINFYIPAILFVCQYFMSYMNSFSLFYVTKFTSLQVTYFNINVWLECQLYFIFNISYTYISIHLIVSGKKIKVYFIYTLFICDTDFLNLFIFDNFCFSQKGLSKMLLDDRPFISLVKILASTWTQRTTRFQTITAISSNPLRTSSVTSSKLLSMSRFASRKDTVIPCTRHFLQARILSFARESGNIGPSSKRRWFNGLNAAVWEFYNFSTNKFVLKS